MKTITLRLTDAEIEQLKHSVEVNADIANDTVTEDLFLPHNVEAQTFTKEDMLKLRASVDERVDRMMSAQTLYAKVFDL